MESLQHAQQDEPSARHAVLRPEFARTASDLRRVLAWLDDLVREALASATRCRPPAAGSDPFRGLHITEAEVAALLRQEPGEPLLAARELSARIHKVPVPRELAPFMRECGLDDFDVAVVLIAAAPDLDLRYERLFAYLQDDVEKRRPTVDLALDLLCGSLVSKVRRRVHFACDAPLRLHRVVRLLPGPTAEVPLLAQRLFLDPQVLAAMLGETGLDARLAAACRLSRPTPRVDDQLLQAAAVRALPALARRHRDAGEPLRLYLQGPNREAKRAAATGMAAELGVALLDVDLARLLAGPLELEEALHLVAREAWLREHVVFFDDGDALLAAAPPQARRCLARHLARAGGITLVAGPDAWAPIDGAPCELMPVPFELPIAEQRGMHWTQALRARGVEPEPQAVRSLAERFQLDAVKIAGAVSAALLAAESQSRAQPTPDELFAAARAQTRHALEPLAARLETPLGWDDLVLPEDTMAQLREIATCVVQRHRVLRDWGFGDKLACGTGLHALFAGPPGTGKTMAAQILARELELDLYRIDLAVTVSKYIGETEKNLDRIFTAARHANAILFFDEADALFGKRTEVKDAHDRYANLEVSYLLQKLEAYEGITVLATNMRQNIDEAFLRRFSAIVAFPAPDRAQRRRLWAAAWPAATPLASDIDLDTLAATHRFTGANIRNVALLASFLAAASGQPVRAVHVAQAAAREAQKIGRSMSAGDPGPGASR